MLGIALSSLRLRKGAFAVTFLNLFVGAAVLMAFSSLLDTAAGPGVSAPDRATMTTMCWVVGGWGVLIVAFGVAATLHLTVRQREQEFALLRSAGALPGQISRLIMGETGAVALLAVLFALPAGYGLGHGVLAALASTGQVARGVDYRFGPVGLGAGCADTFVAAGLAAYVTGRRAAKLSTREALTPDARQEAGLSRKRIWFGVGFLLLGTDAGVLAATVLRDRGYVTMSVAGEACIHVSIGFALLSPALLRLIGACLGALVRRAGGSAGYLAELNVRRTAGRMAGVVMPIILFVGMAAGSLSMQAIQDTALASGRQVRSGDDKGVETLDLVIVATLAVFAAIVLVDLAVAATVARRGEFGRQRLAGATPGQVVGMVGFESALVAVTGLLAGTVAAAASVVPFSIAVAGRAVPAVGPGIYLGVAAAVVVLTFAATLAAAGRALRGPAIEALTGGPGAGPAAGRAG
ncbi:ABC transporter permease [Actinospica robiniae]|uniref:ABC transporter permease n=1 Tax=Actinospica robiniae TaxID=304901 RepID=UPI0003FD5127|nr:ABC transporter permease [Actinospica robiniae]